MYTKEVIALTPKVNEAIKKIAGKMERRCRRCEGIGYKKGNPTHKCSACNGTGRVKGKWEWEPQRGEFAQIGMGMIILVDRDGLFENKFVETSDMGLIEINRLTPLLHWERIEEILEGMGYEVKTFDIQVKRRRWLSHIWKRGKLKDKLVASVDNCKTRQEAVQKAVIELGKEE